MNIYDFKVKDIEGNEVSLEEYRGKTLLIVNTATKCKFSAQYEILEKLYESMQGRNFEILDFPCDQFFNEAPGSNEEIHCLCTSKYGIKFKQFAKVDVIGDNADPLFKYLENEISFQGFGITKNTLSLHFIQKKIMKSVGCKNTDIKWNFTKFLIDKDGNVVARFEPTEPVELVWLEINRLLNGEELGVKNIWKRKTFESTSETKAQLVSGRKKSSAEILGLVYALNFLFAFLILWYVGVAITPMVIVRVMIISIPSAIIIATSYNFIAKVNEMQINKICYALEQATKGDYEYRLVAPENSKMRKAYEDFNKMEETLEVSVHQMEEAVQEAERANEAKSNFLSNMSHEIRTPLNAVLGLDEMIIRESEEEEIVSYATDIRNAGKTLLSLINDILDISKVEAGKMELVPVEYDLSSVINDLVNMVSEKAETKGLEFKVEVNPEMPHILYGDEVRFKQVCLNILNNAVKYTDSGYVRMNFDYEYRGEDFYIKYFVQDTGQGIKEEDRVRLFEPFARIEEEKNRHVEGTGLGMSITKNLLELMGSRLQVESTYGEGSTFSFVVAQKLVKDEPIGNFMESYRKAKENEKKYKECFHAPEARIMVVDDVEMNLTVIKGFLKKTLIKVDTCTSGRDALNLGHDKKYDLIFVDHMMPDMDGIETLHAFRDGDGANKDTPICVLTANAVSGAREKYMEAGFSEYLTKPVDSYKLEQLLLKMLPENLVIIESEEVEEENQTVDPRLEKLKDLEGIDVEAGIIASGGRDSYLNVVENYMNTAADRAQMISDYWKAGDIKNYTIQVHALKSSSRLVGQMSLSKLAEELEASGNAGDTKNIDEKTSTLLENYMALADSLKPVFKEDGQGKPQIEEKLLKNALTSLYEALMVFDMDMADDVMAKLAEYSMPEDFEENYEKIKLLMSEVERDQLMKLLEEING